MNTPQCPDTKGGALPGDVSAQAPGPREVAAFLRNVQGMRCNCDLDNWEPERSTGHSRVCRIHYAAIAADAALKSEVAKTPGATA